MPQNLGHDEAGAVEQEKPTSVPPPLHTGWHSFGRSERTLLAAAAGGLVCVFVLAAWLSPDPRGLGTHEQLGLAPCMTQWLFDVPCPFCGMTTAFAEMAHGRPIRSFATQPAGALIAILCALGAVLCAVGAVIGRYPEAAVRRLQSKGTFIAAAVVVLVAWIYKLGVHAIR
ncbi:MAG: DUF2752 domain-containing protein [bacterium]|nr:DUF2752 domain-containing protein [bacterium]